MSPPDPPISISWSALRAHEECRQKSYLLRTGKRSPASNLRGYFHGMVVDRAMREWLADPDRTPGAMTGRINELIDVCEQEALDDGDGVVRWKNAADRNALREFCVELVDRLQPILAERVLPYRFESACRFKVPVRVPYLDGTITTILLSGEMDLLVHEPERRVVWDLKGTKDDQYWRKVLGQLIFYDLAVYVLYGQPTGLTGLIQPMCTKPVLEFTITDDDRRAMWVRILRMANDIWQEHHQCKDGTDGCNFCEVRHACARFRPTGKTMTLGLGLGLRQAITETT